MFLSTVILGLDISKANFDAALLEPSRPAANNTSSKPRHKAFPNTLAGFERLQEWLGDAQVHACLEATNTYGDALARFLHQHGHTVSIVNPAQIKAFGGSQLAGKQFSHPDKLVAYIGLDIGVQQSGRKKGERGLTKQGDAELRRLLFLCASSSLLCKDTGFRDQYEREKAKGLPSTAALCAVARKMAKLCWSIVKHGTEYDATRVYQQPKANLSQAIQSQAIQSQENNSRENLLKTLQPLDTEP